MVKTYLKTTAANDLLVLKMEQEGPTIGGDLPSRKTLNQI
jgi:hypothetical protein